MSRQPLIELPSPPRVERADPATLDQCYRALLTALALSSTHRQALRHRGLSDAEILRRGYRTLPLHGRAALARRLVDRCGPDICATIPGVYIATHDGRPYWSIAGAPGLLIPVRSVDGHIVALKVRADDPGQGPKFTYVSSLHHSGPSPGAPVHVPLHVFSRGAPVRITEGELKADVATVLSEMLTIAVPGVSAWRKVLPLLQDLQATQILLAFDSDWRTNRHVAQALGHTACALVKAGYAVQVEDWAPMQGKGIDDLLAAGFVPMVQPAALAVARTGSIACHNEGASHPDHAAPIRPYRQRVFARLRRW